MTGLTAAQRAYLAAFDEYIRNPTRDSEQRREFALGVVLLEADVQPELADPGEVERSMGQQGHRQIGS